jgi:glycosyltransferase involved in cell wall biosynthesis
LNSLISIIIPTYNRASLLPETLDSILAQTVSNWECIVVDDGSTDDSQKVFEHYSALDSRFRFLNRPSSKPKGANACRNIGLDNVTGDYIVFFDSDDLMSPNHLEVKLKGITESGCDYVITRTKYFNKDNSQIDQYYNFDQFEITAYNYITQKINWLTYDICLKAPLAKQITFNEQLQAGQEYNYFCKLVLLTTNARFIDEVVTLRRHHEQSIRSGLKTAYLLDKSFFYTNWHTYLDVHQQVDQRIIEFLIWRCVSLSIKHYDFFGVSLLRFYKHLYSIYGWAVIYHLLYIISMKCFKKGYYFQSRFLKAKN